MRVAIGGLTAECDSIFVEQVSLRMHAILENIEDRIFPHSHIVIIDSVDRVFYEIVDGKETKQNIPI